MNPIDEASAALESALTKEHAARLARIEAEQRVVALLPARDAGVVTLRGEAYRASIHYDLRHDVDPTAVASLQRQVPPELLHQAIAMQPVVVPAGLRYLKCNEPEAYAKVIRIITTVRTPRVGVEHLVA